MPDSDDTTSEAAREAEVASPEGDIVARLDLDRLARCGAPEAVFALRKTPEDTLAITETLAARQGFALVTRANAECMELLRRRWPDMRCASRAGAALVGMPPPLRDDANGGKHVAIVCAGTSDLAVAEEAAITLAALGRRSETITDVGVAGLHRLLARLDDIKKAAVVIAVAGMEGALPSVIAGLLSAPVIAAPTSVGYGAGLAGVSALLGMLSSCSPGITVVNIDNGFGAAMAASRMLSI